MREREGEEQGGSRRRWRRRSPSSRWRPFEAPFARPPSTAVSSARPCEGGAVNGMRVEYVDIEPLPFLNTDLEAGGVYPPTVEAFRRKILEADGILFVSPEYNYSLFGTEGMPLAPGSESITPSPREEFQTINSHSFGSLEPPYFIKDSKNKFSVDHCSAMTERMARLSVAPWKTTEHDAMPQPNLHGHPASLCMDANKNGFQYENDLFSCSFSEVLNRKLSLSPDAFFWQSPNTVNAQLTNTVNAKFRGRTF